MSDYSSISSYVKSLPSGPYLDRETELELARSFKNGGENGKEAKQKIVETNLRLVVTLAREHQHLGVEIEDLISEGNIGLLKAVERFDPEIGYRLSTYANWWIRQSMKHAITKQARTIRIPKKSLAKIGKIKKIIRDLAQELGRDPSLEELAAETEIAVENLEKIIGWDTKTISSDARKSEEGQKIIETIIDENANSPAEGSEKGSDQEWVYKLVALLKPYDREIIEARFGWRGEPKTLREIGEQLGITRERVRQLEVRILHKLRQKAREIQSTSKDTETNTG